jgi:hypothetical protein
MFPARRGTIEEVNSQNHQLTQHCTCVLALQVRIISNSSLTRNRAAAGAGGGAAAADNASLVLDGATVEMNRAAGAGGGVKLDGASRMTSVNSFIKLNRARQGGGVSLAPDASIVDLPKLLPGLFNNTALNGPQLAADPVRLTLISNQSAFTYVSRASAQDGALGLQLNVSGALDLPAPGILTAAAIDGTQALGANTTDAKGIAYLSLRARQPAGNYTVSVSLPEYAEVPPFDFSLEVCGCIPGEVSPIPDTCEACIPGFYSLDPYKPLCDSCPANVECPSGAAVLPVLGYWQSAAASAQMHR